MRSKKRRFILLAMVEFKYRGREITQEDINTFAVLTGDEQWIHVDVERAKQGPFGTTIAHGFLTLEDNTEVSYQISESYAPQAAKIS